MPDPKSIREVPTAFISYSWDSESHRTWVLGLGTRLRADGVELLLDEWSTRPGDRLPQFIQTAISDSDYVLIICTPGYKQRSETPTSGVGYEGHMITAELFTLGNERKFVPILKEGTWSDAPPLWLKGKKGFDLRGSPYSEAEYQKLLQTLHGMLPSAPAVGPQPSSVVIQHLDALSVTHQRTYADLVNAVTRTHQAAAQRLLLLKDGGNVARAVLPKFERELEEYGTRAFNLAQEIDLFSSVPVAKAAKALAAQAIAFRMLSTAPALDAQLQKAFHDLIERIIPEFREQVRLELAQRGGATYPL